MQVGRPLSIHQHAQVIIILSAEPENGVKVKKIPE